MTSSVLAGRKPEPCPPPGQNGTISPQLCRNEWEMLFTDKRANRAFPRHRRSSKRLFEPPLAAYSDGHHRDDSQRTARSHIAVLPVQRETLTKSARSNTSSGGEAYPFG